ncbi:hypothetical protein K8W59_08240 [Nocardioides rotundus]|uniref:hypothetical protein n=1 Tax=Nocardioides rotundus TaxID=1774216 RepID=UPI001CC0D047|nr:hypothetical protein [Nocardioides rotundus]UAL31416.1 hypothetical protein K8W59_08240 [Nocardioides rotundus]
MVRALITLCVLLLAMTACSTQDSGGARADRPNRQAEPETPRPTPMPERIRIVPDDYHVPYAGTAEDGRRFFLSDELFEPGGAAYVGLFLWEADGSFSEIRVDEVTRAEDVPPGMAASAGRKDLVKKRLAELGDFTLEPITVEPFTRTLNGVTFGWKATRFQGSLSIHIEPGNFIAYYAPWDGEEYDT